MIEMGVFEGATALAMLQGNATSNYVGVDSFSGLSTPDPEFDGNYWREGDLSASKAWVRENLKPHMERVELFEGWIPEVLGRLPDLGSYSLGHVDVDLFQPTLASLEFLAERLSNGGVIICDDYGFSTCPGARQAVDSFLKDHSDFVLVHLPTGQALIQRKD